MREKGCNLGYTPAQCIDIVLQEERKLRAGLDSVSTRSSRKAKVEGSAYCDDPALCSRKAIAEDAACYNGSNSCSRNAIVGGAAFHNDQTSSFKKAIAGRAVCYNGSTPCSRNGKVRSAAWCDGSTIRSRKAEVGLQRSTMGRPHSLGKR